MISSKVSLFYSAKHVIDMKRSEMEMHCFRLFSFIKHCFWRDSVGDIQGMNSSDISLYQTKHLHQLLLHSLFVEFYDDVEALGCLFDFFYHAFAGLQSFAEAVVS